MAFRLFWPVRWQNGDKLIFMIQANIRKTNAVGKIFRPIKADSYYSGTIGNQRALPITEQFNRFFRN